jgi:hypothetical protein
MTKLKEQHKIEIMNCHTSRENSDLETSMSTVDGYKMTESHMYTQEDVGMSNDFLMEYV